MYSETVCVGGNCFIAFTFSVVFTPHTWLIRRNEVVTFKKTTLTLKH